MSGKPRFNVQSTGSLADELMGAAPAPAAPPRAAPEPVAERSPPLPPPPTPARRPAWRGDALAAVQAARDSAREDPRAWQSFSVRLPAVLVQRLSERLAADQLVTHDFTLALSHYLEAALAAVPSDLDRAAGWGFAWRKRSAGQRAGSTPTGSRLHKDTALAMHLLPGRLRTLGKRPNAWEIMAEALARLLDGLDAG